MPRNPAVPAIIALVAVSLTVIPAAWDLYGEAPASSTQPDRAVNPHWSTQGCTHCHRLNPPRTIPHEQVNDLCWSCHDGRRAGTEPHPVGRRFVSDQMVQPAGWPTLDGQITCLTCHEIRAACDAARNRPAVNPAFLRERGRESLVEWCARCHLAARTGPGQRYNPHRMIDESGQVSSQACLFCHTDNFEPDRLARRTGEPRLRSDGLSLCAPCHREHMDYFEPGHIGHPVTSAILKNLRTTSARFAPATAPAGTTRPAESVSTVLPLSDDYRIVCHTCHNPHARGVFPGDSPLAEGAMAVAGGENRLGLRFGRDVCRACHRSP